MSADPGTNSPTHNGLARTVVLDQETHDALDRLFKAVQRESPQKITALLWDDQRNRWLAGKPVPVDDYLQRLPASLYDTVATDLIYGELTIRKSIGQSPTIEEYASRFPRIAPELQRQLSIESALIADEKSEIPTTPDPQALQTPEPSDIPERIGKYRVITKLGSGGQGSVYRAIHPSLQRDVVIKLFDQLSEQDDLATGGFLSEGRILAELDHPNMARVFDCDVHDGRPFLVMEYIAGRNLEQFASTESMTPNDAAALVARIARALAEVHRRGVCHFDIKPLNILVDDQKNPRLIDFGLAKLNDAWRTNTSFNLAGSLAYMAPEQANVESDLIGPRSDIFALGGVLYFLLVGRAPFSGDNLQQMLNGIKECQWNDALLDDRGIPKPLGIICRKAMHADPTRRHASADAMADELEAFTTRRRPNSAAAIAAVAAIAVALLLAIGAFAFSRTSRDDADSPAPVEPSIAATESQPAQSQPVQSQPVQSQPEPLIATQQATLAVRVWNGQRYIQLIDALPLAAADQLQLVADVPPSLHAALFVFDSAANLERLKSVDSGQKSRDLRFPDVGQAAPLEGPAGTSVVLVCGRRSQAIDEAELRELFSALGGLPQLPGVSLLRLRHDGVVMEQQDRGFGPAVDHPDPEGEVKRFLEQLHEQLAGKYAYFEAVAFGHEGN